VHDIYPRKPQSTLAEASWKSRPRDVFHRHFKAISMHLSTPRRRARPYSPLHHLYDRELACAFAIAFPDRPSRKGEGPLAMVRAWLSRLFSA
jgi:hypothetical protein